MSTEALDDTQPAASDSGALLVAKISRFEVREKLGEGGNGVVLLARDPTLDRNVAIKILRRRGDTEASQRLLREAQSAAKIAHDGVIVVHEVGTHDDQVYVAMEYVPGGTLTTWQRGKPWRDVLDVYLRAGRGLAAAHAAGMVHRDFKPDNVLVGDDGRVRVTDFGLVTVSSGKPPDDVRDLELTKTGTVMGTPRYMAPEQHLGEDVDPRTDQFAFCVALYEALWKQPPFVGETYGVLADHVLAGDIAPPPSSPVPSRIRSAILRGLSRARDDRFPSMTALLAELAPRPGRPRWLVPIALALVVACGVGAFVLFRRGSETVREPAAAREPAVARDAAIVGDALDDLRAEFRRAEDAYKRGDYAAAAEGFRHVFELDPDLDGRGPVYLYDMAVAYKKVGNCVEAVRGFRHYLALVPDAGDRAEVEKTLRALGNCEETSSPAYKEGEAAYNRGDFPAAIAAFKRAFELTPNLDKSTAAYMFDIAQAYRQMRDCRNASTSFKKFLVLSDGLAPDKRAHVEQWIKELEACVAAEEAAAKAAGSATR